MLKLDAIDHAIIRMLQKDATRAIQDIAEVVGLTTNPCWRRIKKLESQGIISKRIVSVDPTKIGLGTTAMVSIKTDSHTKEWHTQFVNVINDIPEIIECHRMTGDVDYMMVILVSNLAHYDDVYQRLLSRVNNLGDVSSAFSMECIKRDRIIDSESARFNKA